MLGTVFMEAGVFCACYSVLKRLCSTPAPNNCADCAACFSHLNNTGTAGTPTAGAATTLLRLLIAKTAVREIQVRGTQATYTSSFYL